MAIIDGDSLYDIIENIKPEKVYFKVTDKSIGARAESLGYKTYNLGNDIIVIELSTEVIIVSPDNFEFTNTNTGILFGGNENLKEISFKNIDTSHVEEMKWVFSGCSSLQELDLSNFNTIQATTMTGMFNNCKNLKRVDITNFNTTHVKDMGWMFRGCKELKEISLSNFNTTHVKDMGGMFQDCKKLKELSISNFNTEKVMDMRGMFKDCESLEGLDISNFVITDNTDTSNMFENCIKLRKLYINAGIKERIMKEIGEVEIELSGNQSIKALSIDKINSIENDKLVIEISNRY